MLLRNNYALEHIIEQSNGNLYYLGFNESGKQVNFIANPMDLCLIDRKEKLKVPGFGAVFLSYKSDEKNKYEEIAQWLNFQLQKAQVIYNIEIGLVDSIETFKQKLINS